MPEWLFGIEFEAEEVGIAKTKWLPGWALTGVDRRSREDDCCLTAVNIEGARFRSLLPD